MVKALIIDDEEPARNLIRHFLKDYPEIELLGECINGFEGFKTIEDLRPDLIFLDIQMPKISGFEMLELIDKPPVTIFSTAFDEFALKAFDHNAIDYLMKPYSKERFAVAVAKALEKVKESSGKEKENSQLHEILPHQETLDKIVVRNGSLIQIIPLDEINYIEAQDDYVAIHCKEGKFLKQARMKSLEKRLPAKLFVRIHRSYILRIDRLKKIENYSKDSFLATIEGGKSLPLSRSGYHRLKELLNI